MKVLRKKPELCIACHACETTCSNTWFKENNIEKSCVKIGEGAASSNKNTITTCTQCGECMAVCPIEALTCDKNGIVRVNKKNCVGCFMCVGFCAEHAMMMHEDYMEPFKCVACGQCVRVCPTNAIFIEEV
jgi:Fe-S-cluster-containing dehydrogenase component